MTNGLLTLSALLGCVFAAAGAAPAAAQCMLCDAKVDAAKPVQPLSMDVDASLDFSKVGLVALNQGGTVEIDPDTGQRTITGALVDLGGFPMQGSAVIRGEPRERVRVDMPNRITLTSPDGDRLELSNFETSLKNNPRIGNDGLLRFTFGARLRVDGRSDGDFRGSIPITVDYR